MSLATLAIKFRRHFYTYTVSSPQSFTPTSWIPVHTTSFKSRTCNREEEFAYVLS